MLDNRGNNLILIVVIAAVLVPRMLILGHSNANSYKITAACYVFLDEMQWLSYLVHAV